MLRRLRWKWQGRFRLKWRIQRARRGWSDRDWWNMDWYLTEVTVAMLRHMRDHGHGGPVTYAGSFEEWQDTLTALADHLQEARDDLDDPDCSPYAEVAFVSAWKDVAEVMPALWD